MEKNKIKVMGMKQIKDRKKDWLFTLGTGSKISVSHT